FVRIDRDTVFLNATALNADTCDSGNRRKRWAQGIESEIAQLDERMRIGGQTVGNHRKHCWIHALDFERCARRQTRKNFVYLRLALKHRRNHVLAPIEIDRYFRGAATGCRSQVAHTRNGAHYFLDRRRNFDGHLLGRSIASIKGDTDAWETDLREEPDRQ